MSEIERDVEAALRELPPHEQQLLRRRFGIGMGPGEESWHPSVSVRVHSIEWRALRKLRLAAVAAR